MPPKLRLCLSLAPYLLAPIGIPAVVLVAERSQKPRAEATVFSEDRGATDISIAGVGLVESEREDVRISPATSGLVKAVEVEPGQTVAAGQILFHLDDREAQAERGRRVAQVKLLEARRDSAQLEVREKQDTLDRQLRLASANVATEEEVTRVRFARDRALAQAAVTEAELATAVADLRAAEVALDRLSVKAPRAGQVLQVSLRAGEIVEASSNRPALILGSTDRFQVRVEVDEENAARVVPGQAATGRIKGATGAPVPLRFLRIEPLLIPKRSLTGESTERVDTRVLQVIFTFTPDGARIYSGQQMDVLIENQNRT